MKSSLCLVVLLAALAVADPIYWVSSIPDGSPGNPVAREFQTLTNVPGTSINVLFGGVTYNQTTFNLNDTWILDTSVPVWKLVDITSAPPARGYAVAGATATEVIVFGGQNEAVPRVYFSDVWRFSLSALNWTKDSFVVPSVLLARSFHAGVLVGDTLYVFGGFSQALQAVTNDVWAYNTTSKTWALRSANGRADAPIARQGHSAVFYNDTARGPSIIFFGGYNGTGGSSDTWQFVISSAAWIQLTKNNDPMGPSPRWGASAIFSVSPVPTVTIFGGSYVGGPINPYYNDVWSLSLAGSAWNWTLQLPDGDVEGPWKRGGHSSVISAGRAFTFGGYGLFVGLYNDLWELVNF